jgi:hypothetical protein
MTVHASYQPFLTNQTAKNQDARSQVDHPNLSQRARCSTHPHTYDNTSGVIPPNHIATSASASMSPTLVHGHLCMTVAAATEQHHCTHNIPERSKNCFLEQAPQSRRSYAIYYRFRQQLHGTVGMLQGSTAAVGTSDRSNKRVGHRLSCTLLPPIFPTQRATLIKSPSQHQCSQATCNLI